MNTNQQSQGLKSTMVVQGCIERPRQKDVFILKAWRVVHDTIDPDGRHVLDVPLSASYLKKRAAKKAFDRIVKIHPDAVFTCSRYFFNRLRAGDMKRRSTLLTSFRGG